MMVRVFILLGLSLCLTTPCPPQAGEAAFASLAQQNQTGATTDIAVVVNPVNPVDSISSIELRKIFAGEKQSWSDSLAVFLMVRAPQARERDVLLNQVLKMNEPEYKQYWVKKIQSGEVQREPLAVQSNGMQLEAIRAEKGGIALINMADVREGVKVLKVDGHLPGSEGYVLK
jgi:ABC-type phosphate transport system substrate-binding protein